MLDAEVERALRDADRLEGEAASERARRRQHVGAAAAAARLAAGDDAERPSRRIVATDLALGAVELPGRVASDDGDVRRGAELGDEPSELDRPARSPAATAACCSAASHGSASDVAR